MAGETVQDVRAGSEARPGESGRPVWLEIDLTAVEHNARLVKELIGPRRQLLAVVKADGYGLGAHWMAEAAIRGGATWLGVACVDEGAQLRNVGFTQPILVMSYADPSEARRSIENNLTQVIAREKSADALEAAAAELGVPAASVPVHIKVDTGLRRYGCLPAEVLALARHVLACKHLYLQGLMTHFATADAPDLSFVHEQLALFNQVLRATADAGIHFDIVHAANSAATLAVPESRFDMVRVGIMLSGQVPSDARKGVLPIRQAVRLVARIARVFPLKAGESVGYGRTWVAPGPGTAALIPIGYADGFQRSFSNRGFVLVGGKRCPVIGRVSMDQAAVDVSQVPGVLEGAEAVILGRQGDEEITADDLARWDDTISYEILTGFGRRLPRRYMRDGRAVATCDLLGCSTFGRREDDASS